MDQPKTTTVRDMLTYEGFDWESGQLIIQRTDSPQSPGFGDSVSAKYIESDAPILDIELETFSLKPKCPRFIASDKNALYFPTYLDGMLTLVKVFKDIDAYLDHSIEIPYHTT